MRFAVTVKTIIKHNLNDFFYSGDPDVIYSFLTAELLECEPADLILLYDLLKREVANVTDTSSTRMSALTKRFFSGLRDVLYGILAEKVEGYKAESNFIPLGQILNHALTVDPQIMHKVGQMVYHDGYIPEILERANNSTMYTYHTEIEDHFQKMQNNVRAIEKQVDAGTLDGDPNWYQPVLAEIRLLNLLDVVNCYNDALLKQAASSDFAIKMEDE